MTLADKLDRWLSTPRGAQFAASVLSARKDKSDIDATLAGRPPKNSIWPDVIGEPSAPSEYWLNMRDKMLCALDDMLALGHTVYRASTGEDLTAAETETIENLIRSRDD